MSIELDNSNPPTAFSESKVVKTDIKFRQLQIFIESTGDEKMDRFYRDSFDKQVINMIKNAERNVLGITSP